jgi:glycosyltransferase involved in cell wall biosynthesis
LRVHQIVPVLASGDAVSNQVLSIHDILTAWGVESHIFAYDMDAYTCRYASPDAAYGEFAASGEDVVIYHHAIYCEHYRMFLGSNNHKVLIYHNITPPEFYTDFYPTAARICRLGRELLPRLTGCDLALGDSDYNRRELVAAGFEEEKTGVLPINPPLDKLDGVEEDAEFSRRLGDGKLNLLFVGRVAPNKRVEDLIKLFYCYNRGINAASRLVVAGSLLTTYHAALLSLARRMGIQDRVLFLGKVSDSRLKSCYLHSHYYVSMSEHEGFCVPPLEAFHFDLPVLAYAAGAVPETMGGAGVIFDVKDYPRLAELVERLERDTLLRERILAAQRERLQDFGTGVLAAGLRDVLDRLLPGPAPLRDGEELVEVARGEEVQG